jgi:hypothetical protein
LIFLGHPNDQLLDFFADWRLARCSTCMRPIEFASDEPSVPSQDGVWQSGSRHLAEGLPAQSMADFTERNSLSV